MATTTSHNKKSSAVKRILSEARELKEPTPEYAAYPLDDNIFEWHFTLRGPSQTEFEEGIYHGRIILPAEYPFRPPDVMVMTPNGRWELNKKICLTFTGFHEEMWQPAWGIRTALIGVQAFMGARAEAAIGIGSLDYPIAERERLAKISGEWKCPKCNVTNRETLPEVERDSRIQESLPEGLTVDPNGGGKNQRKEDEASPSNGEKDSSSNKRTIPPAPLDLSGTNQSNSFECNQGPTNEMIERLVRSGLDEANLHPSISSSQVSTPGRLTPQPQTLPPPSSTSPFSQTFPPSSKGKERERSIGESNEVGQIQETSTSSSHPSSSIRPPIAPSIDRQNSQPLPLPSLNRIRFARMAIRAGASSAEASAQRLAALDRAIVTVICLLAALILRRILNTWS